MGNHVIHFEVTGRDAPALQKFYSEVFGWKIDANNPNGYGWVEHDPGEIVGGIGPALSGPGQTTFYVRADDPEGVLRHVEQLGGKVIMPLTEVAPNTKIALFADPEGHVIGLG